VIYDLICSNLMILETSFLLCCTNFQFKNLEIPHSLKRGDEYERIGIRDIPVK